MNVRIIIFCFYVSKPRAKVKWLFSYLLKILFYLHTRYHIPAGKITEKKQCGGVYFNHIALHIDELLCLLFIVFAGCVIYQQNLFVKFLPLKQI